MPIIIFKDEMSLLCNQGKFQNSYLGLKETSSSGQHLTSILTVSPFPCLIYFKPHNHYLMLFKPISSSLSTYSYLNCNPSSSSQKWNEWLTGYEAGLIWTTFCTYILSDLWAIFCYSTWHTRYKLNVCGVIVFFCFCFFYNYMYLFIFKFIELIKLRYNLV